MKKTIFLLTMAFGLGGCFLLGGTSGGGTVSNDVEHADVETLIQQMTIEEKVGQMTQLNLDVVCVGEIYNLSEPHRIDPDKLNKALKEWHVGSFLNCGGHAYPLEQWHTLIGEIQRVAMTETRLKIPVIYGIDAIHGANYVMGSTLFPQQLAQAATFNPTLVQQAATITAYETRAAGIPWNFSPVLDAARHPAWSRFFETYGEDPYTVSRFGEACIAGYQGQEITRSNDQSISPSNDQYRVAACMKHFLGYGGARTGKDRTPAYISDIQLREIYLPSFKAAIEQGAMTVMINSGEITGVPVHANKKILTTLLRDELKFGGIVVTDWEDIIKLHMNHKVAPTLKEAVYMAVDAGIDMAMVPNDFEFSRLLIELVKEGRISEARLNESVRRILLIKKKMKLLDHSGIYPLSDYPNFGSKAFQLMAKETAGESITLLENNGVLPLNKDTKVLVTGPGANSLVIQNGAWTRTWQGTEAKYNDETKLTIAEAILQFSANAQYAEGCGIQEKGKRDEALAAAANADVIVVCLAEWPSTEKVGDIDDLSMSRTQIDFVKELKKTGKKIVLILVENRPLLVNEIVSDCDAIVMAYQPGDYGGEALAEILYGTINPSGKLPFTYPRFNQSLLMYDHKYTETVDQKFGNNAFQPQWPFGHGLSYSNILYEKLECNTDTLKAYDQMTVRITVKNPSTRAAKESVILYLHDQYATVTPAVRRVIDFQKVDIAAGESRVVEFKVDRKDLEFVNADIKWVTEDGHFDLMVANQKTSFYYQYKP
ncbi:MAG: beta-glucosidase family protein [Flavobacteriales bacterium]